MSYNLISVSDLIKQISQAAKLKRLSLDLSQKSLALRSGVSLGALKKFELTGKISLESLLKLALVLESLDEFSKLFPEKNTQLPNRIEDLFKDTTRKRGRK